MKKRGRYDRLVNFWPLVTSIFEVSQKKCTLDISIYDLYEFGKDPCIRFGGVGEKTHTVGLTLLYDISITI